MVHQQQERLTSRWGEEDDGALMLQQQHTENPRAISNKGRGITVVGTSLLFAVVLLFGCRMQNNNEDRQMTRSAGASASSSDFEKILFKSETADMTLIDQELDIEGKGKILRQFAYNMDIANKNNNNNNNGRALQIDLGIPDAPGTSPAPTMSSMPSAAPSVSPAPTSSSMPSSTPTGAPSAMPIGTPSSSPTAMPFNSPSAAPTTTAMPTSSLSPSSAPSVDDRIHAAVYMIFWGYRGFGCESPVSEMYASCGENATLSILDMANENYNCAIDTSTNSSMVCAGQPDSHMAVRCETQGYDPEALVMTVTLTEDSLSCDGCIGGQCANQGIALQRAFLFTLCDGDLFENNNNCTGVVKLDNGGHRYCETRTGCEFTFGGAGCTADLDPVILESTGLLSLTTGFQCIETLARPTEAPSAMPSSMPSTSPTRGLPTASPSMAPSEMEMEATAEPSSSPTMMMTNSSAPSMSPTTTP